MYIWELFGIKNNYNYKAKNKYAQDAFYDRCDKELGLGVGTRHKEISNYYCSYKLPNGLYISVLHTGMENYPSARGGIYIKNAIGTENSVKTALAQGALSGATGGITDLFSYFKPGMSEARKVLKETKRIIEERM